MPVLMYLAAVLSAVVQSASAKLFNRHSDSAATFNFIKALTALGLFALLAVGGFTLHLPTLLWGLAFGACQAASMYAGYRALCLGPMAPTSMLVSFSVAMPILWGLSVGGEALKPLQIPGLILLFAAMILTNADKLFRRLPDTAAPRSAGGYGVWLSFVALTFLCNGCGSILQKEHQVRYPAAYTREFMLAAMLVCALSFSVLLFLKRAPHAHRPTGGKRYGVLAGVTMGLSGFLTLSLSGAEKASILFPMISAGTLLGVLLCGRLLFRERLRLNHYLALLCGILAVVLLKL
ncbi:MAG: hypothetical protein J6T24_01155 [Clostridia bacterium]|nr:hypothetical protein [Clostridia bacterium]